MSDEGTVTATLDGQIMTITVDREAKMNSFTPSMFDQLSDAMTALEQEDAAWVGVLVFKGRHTTAGLDLPKFAVSMRGGPDTEQTAPDDRVDAFSIRRRCSKPVVMAVQGVCFTIGIEMMLGVDIVVAAEDARFCQLEPMPWRSAETHEPMSPTTGASMRTLLSASWGEISIWM